MPYALTGHQPEAERLARLSDTVAALTDRLLADVDLPERSGILDIGSGSGRLAVDLALGAPGRTAVGIDVDETLLTTARELAARRGAARACFLRASGGDLPFPDDGFDLVVCRFLLMHVPDPGKVVAEMARVCRPGGTVLAIEADWEGQLLHPLTPAIARYRELAVAVARRAGMNPYQGRELFGLFKRAGLTCLRVTAHAEVSTADDPQTVSHKLRARMAMADHLTADRDGARTDPEAGLLRAEIERLLASPDLFATEFRVAALGRVPVPRT